MGIWNFKKKKEKFDFSKLPNEILTQIENFYNDDISLKQLKEVFEIFNVNDNEFSNILNKHHLSINWVINQIKQKKKEIKFRKGRRVTLKFGMKAAATALGVGAGILKPSLSQAKKKIDPKGSKVYDLFSKLSTNKEMMHIRRPICLGDEYKTIILIGDAHAGNRKFTKYDLSKSSFDQRLTDDETWRREFNQLEILRNEFGLSFVGLEGWAGKDVDNKRGRQILNAEIFLIKSLLSNSNYSCVGLEDSKLQLRALQAMMYIRILEDKYNLLSYLEFKKHFVDFFFFKNKLDLYEPVLSYTLLEDYKKQIMKEFDISDFSLKKLAELVLNFLSLFTIFIILNSKNISTLDLFLEEFDLAYKNLLKIFSQYKRNSNDVYREEVIMPRDIYASKKMLDEMSLNRKQIGIMVFGLNHIDGIVRELRRLTDDKINIYVAR